MTVVIAEIGVDHEGAYSRALTLAETVFVSGADILKTQYYKEGLRGPNRILPRLPECHMHDLDKLCNRNGVEFLVTAHDRYAIDFILGDMGLGHSGIKLGSGGWHLLPHIPDKTFLYISTGMHTQAEIAELASKLRDRKGRSVIMHCVSEYPCLPDNAQLQQINYLQQLIHGIDNLYIGYSDHTKGTHIPLAAIGMGAKVIEKHVTIDRNVKGKQDTFCSLTTNELWPFVQQVRAVDAAMKDKDRRITLGERETIKWLQEREKG